MLGLLEALGHRQQVCELDLLGVLGDGVSVGSHEKASATARGTAVSEGLKARAARRRWS